MPSNGGRPIPNVIPSQDKEPQPSPSVILSKVEGSVQPRSGAEKAQTKYSLHSLASDPTSSYSEESIGNIQEFLIDSICYNHYLRRNMLKKPVDHSFSSFCALSRSPC